eukprot:817756-Pyramimonas_sp.AAC.1
MNIRHGANMGRVEAGGRGPAEGTGQQEGPPGRREQEPLAAVDGEARPDRGPRDRRADVGRGRDVG